MNTITVKITATLEFENLYGDDTNQIVKDLIGEFIKIKSGLYENVACGNVDTAEVVEPDNTEETS